MVKLLNDTISTKFSSVSPASSKSYILSFETVLLENASFQSSRYCYEHVVVSQSIKSYKFSL